MLAAIQQSAVRATSYLTDLLTKTREKDLKDATKAVTVAEADLNALNTKQSFMAGAKADILNAARAQSVRDGDANGLLDVAVAVLEAKKTAGESEADFKAKTANEQSALKKAWASVIDTVKEQESRAMLLVMPRRLQADDAPSDLTRTDVIDQYITLLKYGQTLAISNGATKRAQELRAAIQSAEAQKSEMTFIRPASAYLRSSFAATGLQDNTSFSWSNMLVKHARRSLPGGQSLESFYGKPTQTAIVDDIDKQYWQNINRVRVAAAGETNYAIAKDDIGNWYVKSYSADTTAITESARNLAMFSLSGQPGLSNLRNSIPAPPQPGTGETPAQQESAKPGLERVFERHTETYESKAGQDFDRMTDILSEGGLKTSILQVWSLDEDTKPYVVALSTKLEAAYKSIEADRTDVVKKTGDDGAALTYGDLAAKIPTGLRLTMRFYRTLVSDIDGSLTSAPALAVAQAEADIVAESGEAVAPLDARQNLTARQQDMQRAERGELVASSKAETLTREILQDFLTNRIGRVNNYKTAITFIGEAAQPAQ